MKRPLLTGACESYNYLAALADKAGLPEVQATLEQLETRWEARLTHTMQLVQVSLM